MSSPQTALATPAGVHGVHGGFTGGSRPDMNPPEQGVTGVHGFTSGLTLAAPPRKGRVRHEPPHEPSSENSGRQTRGSRGEGFTLHAWVQSLKSRGLAITTGPLGPTFDGPTRTVTDTDADMARRHAHALTVAATGTHPAWWARAAIDPTAPVQLDDLPTVPDPSSSDGLAFACAACGQPADVLDQQLLAWCGAHK